MMSDGTPKLPIDPSAFSKIRLGKGVVGKVGYVGAFCVVGTVCVAVPIAFAGFAYLAAGVVLAGVGAGIYCMHSMIKFAEKSPGAALLEDAEFIRYTEIQQSAKEPQIIDLEAEPVANIAAPQAILSGDK